MTPETQKQPSLWPATNPLGLFSGFKVLAILAIVLKAAGVPNFLREKAAASENKIDDALAESVATLIEKLAAL